MIKFRSSSSFDKLDTGKSARLRRVEAAIRATIGQALPIENLHATKQASATVCTVRGVEILISYLTVVAYKLPDGSSVATERNEFSRTTDRSVEAFCRPSVRMWQPEFNQALRDRLAD